jgi:hypothetical protein
MAHFLRTTGYLWVRDVFSPQEIAGFLACTEPLRADARKGDRDSWWGRNSRGQEILCRVTRAASQLGLRPLPSDPRVVGLVSLADETLVLIGEGAEGGISIIFKNPDMVEGLSDLPWHRDCGMGGHAVMCPILIVSVFLSSGGPEAGELRVLPGSWRGSCPYIDANDPRAPRGVSPATAAGDVLLHYGDVMHAAPPPTRNDLEHYRTSAVMAFARPGSRPHRGERNYNDVLLSRDDGQVEHLADFAKRR